MKITKKELDQLIESKVKQMISEFDFNIFKKKKPEPIIFHMEPNIWTHMTSSDELIDHLKRGDDFIGHNEDLKMFNVVEKGSFATFVNQNAPNFKKGNIFPGHGSKKYMVTTDLPDYAFQPNWNAKNYNSFHDSQNVGVLRPNYRDAKYFKLWVRNKDSKYELIDTLNKKS